MEVRTRAHTPHVGKLPLWATDQRRWSTGHTVTDMENGGKERRRGQQGTATEPPQVLARPLWQGRSPYSTNTSVKPFALSCVLVVARGADVDLGDPRVHEMQAPLPSEAAPRELFHRAALVEVPFAPSPNGVTLVQIHDGITWVVDAHHRYSS